LYALYGVYGDDEVTTKTTDARLRERIAHRELHTAATGSRECLPDFGLHRAGSGRPSRSNNARGVSDLEVGKAASQTNPPRGTQGCGPFSGESLSYLKSLDTVRKYIRDRSLFRDHPANEAGAVSDAGFSAPGLPASALFEAFKGQGEALARPTHHELGPTAARLRKKLSWATSSVLRVTYDSTHNYWIVDLKKGYTYHRFWNFMC
jgi:hypothetical protein